MARRFDGSRVALGTQLSYEQPQVLRLPSLRFGHSG